MQAVVWMVLIWFVVATLVGIALGSLLRHLDHAGRGSAPIRPLPLPLHRASVPSMFPIPQGRRTLR